MKTINIIKRTAAIILAFLLLSISDIHSQGTDTRISDAKGGRFFLGLNIVPKNSHIKNDVLPGSGIVATKGKGLDFSFEAGYFFSKYAGISTGAGLSTFSSSLMLDSYTDNYETTDSELEDFRMEISGDSIFETQKIRVISIPLCLNLRFPATEKFAVFLKGGVSFNIPMAKTYESSGVFTYKGYYPAYPILLENLPAYGFPTDLQTPSSGNLEVKSMFTALLASAGASYSVSKSLKLELGVLFTKSLGNISGYAPADKFILSPASNELKSFMEGSTKSGVGSLGLNIGLRFSPGSN